MRGRMGRTEKTAPPEVQERGGVAMSLWMAGANRSDCVIVAYLSKRCEELETTALNREKP